MRLKKGAQNNLSLRKATVSGKAGLSALVTDSSLSQVIKKHRVSSLEPAFRAAREEGKAKAVPRSANEQSQVAVPHGRPGRSDLFRWYRLKLPPEAELEAVMAELRKNTEVEIVEPNYEYRAQGLEDLPDSTTDPAFVEQCHLLPCKIPQLWAYLSTNGVNPGGLRDVVVAVIDTGVDYTHPELVGNMWVNGGEIPGNGVDDDNDGFVDDVHGCSVVSDARSHSGDPMDQHGHGTHVAGLIGATAFNHQGGVGVAFNVQIMAVRAGQYGGVFTTTDIAEGLLYAVDHGADVINMSFGGYQRSQIQEDAMSVAFSQAVLVAAAGNDSYPTENAPNVPSAPFYPAALPWVLGVMATDVDEYNTIAWFSNFDPCPETRYEYEVAAPGSHNYSTLPGNQYASWSGTSMAAPVVSGVAALLRSFYSDRAIYSSRFIMSQIAGTTDGEKGGEPGQRAPIMNAYRAASDKPVPGVTVLENWVFDDPTISTKNDGDGRVDAGETVHLALELINRSGMASNVVVTLEAKAGAVGTDPYVTMLTNSINYGVIGPFNTADNGFIYDAGGVITGVERPFVFQVVSNCPNDHVIPFVATIKYRNGWDPEDTTVYERTCQFSYTVQRGKDVPRVISTNMVLSAEDFWIVASPVLIEPGATLTIGPGTQVQWGGISDDPYNPGPQNGNMVVRGNLRVEGTCEQPVSFFPSYLVAGQVVNITVEGGAADLGFVKVRNPYLTGISTVDHGYFDWDLGSSTISAEKISNSVFHKLRGGGSLEAHVFQRCLFDAGWLAPNSGVIQGCTFLQDNENNRPVSISIPITADKSAFGGIDVGYYEVIWIGITNVVTRSNYTYATLPVDYTRLQEAELIAQYFGGHVASIADQAEQTFLEWYVQQWSGYGLWGNTTFIGLSDEGHPGDYRWVDGTAMNYSKWASGLPAALSPFTKHVVAFSRLPVNLPGWLGTWKNMEPISCGWGDPRGIGFGMHFILKLPGTWTADQLNAAVVSGDLLNYVRARFHGDIRYNAFLSKYWDPNLDHWMRVCGTSGYFPQDDPRPHRVYSAMYDNYWGTASTELIDHAILDYNDDFVSSTIDYLPAPTNGFATTYPFVEQVLINGMTAESIPMVGAGQTEFTIKFNRAMNTNIEPFVTFGPSSPHTDYTVRPVDTNFVYTTNGWVNTQTWKGSFWMTPMTGNGYHLMRISGAVAADDPWLVSGYDVARFRFQVQTMGVASMTLQANGREGRIDLSWQQNDYDLLAGYNLYRATNSSGPYARLNTTIIPAGQEAFTDTNVVPGRPMFYKFTVLTTGFEESDFSNVASAAAVDTIPPILNHVAVTTAPPARGLQIKATATDNLRVQSVTLQYRASGSTSNYTSVAMVNVSSNNWSATIPGSAVQPPGLEYYLLASDGISQAYSGTPLLPHVVTVSAVPTLSSVTPNQGSASGGTRVTLAGTLFEPGSTVMFGGALASDVVLVTANQLTCLTPPHFPALVDVKVTNTDGTSATLLNGFRYVDTAAVVSLAATNGYYGSQVELPLSAANVTGLRAGSITVTFNAAVLSLIDVRLGTLTAGWSVSHNQANPGRVLISLAGATSVTGSGSLAILKFSVVGAPTTSSPLTLGSVSLNDGAITASLSDGLFTVSGFFQVAGKVNYFSGSKAVPGTDLALAGTGSFSTTTATNGLYVITNIPTGSYTLSPQKTNDVAEITAYDASLVLQADAHAITLSAEQVLAGDVNRNGAVSAMDAAYILEMAVGLIEAPFPGAGKLWEFVPNQRSYALLNGDLTGQDFTAVLIGDVSGNWEPGSPPQGGPWLAGGKRMKDEGSSDAALVAVDSAPVAATGEQIARVLLQMTNPAVYSADLVLSYTPTNQVIVAVESGTDTGFAIASNTNTPGIIRVGLADSEPSAINGPLVLVRFADSEPVNVQVDQISLNEDLLPTPTATRVATFDCDNDGLIYHDELNAFHTDPANPDTDGDGMKDGVEVRAGTNPLDRLSVFALRACTVAVNGSRQITWSAVPGRRYQLEYRDCLADSSWTETGPVVTADQETLSVWDDFTVPGSARLYRVRLVQ